MMRKGLTILLLVLSLTANHVGRAQSSATRFVPIQVRKAVFSPARGLLYAMVPPDAPDRARTITAINPATGQIVASVPLPAEPFSMALAPTEDFLYVGHVGGKISKLRLDTFQVAQTYGTDSAGVSYPVVFDIEVLPDRPDSVVALIRHQAPSGLSYMSAVAVFDNGVMRPRYVAPRPIPEVLGLAFGADANTVWANGNYNRFTIVPDGITLTHTSGSIAFDDYDPVSYEGLLYAREGRVADPERNLVQADFYLTGSNRMEALALDRPSGTAYFLASYPGDYRLAAFDIHTFRLVGMSGSLGAGYGEGMVSCGSAGLAIWGFTQQLMIVPLSAFSRPASWVPPAPNPLGVEVRRIPLPNSGLVADPSRGLLYASLPNWAADIGNSVVAIDPVHGSVGQPVWVGADPAAMTLSAGGQYLYAALQRGFAVARVRLPDLVPDLRIPLYEEDRGYGEPPTNAAEMLPVAGVPQSIIVLRARVPGSQYDIYPAGIAVYDGLQKRPLSTGKKLDPLAKSAQLSETGQSVYTYPDFQELDVTSQGLTLRAATPGVVDPMNSVGRVMSCESRLCFTADGYIIDAPTQERIGEFPFDLSSIDFGLPVAVRPDLARGLVYFLTYPEYGGQPRVVIEAFDVRTMQSAGKLVIASPGRPNGGFLLWRNDQLAVSTEQEVLLIPLALVHQRPLLAEPVRDLRWASRLAFPFVEGDDHSFTGVAVSNVSELPASGRWVHYGTDGSPRYYQPNYLPMSVSSNTQYARLAHEILQAEQFGGWLELETDNPAIGGFFMYRNNNGFDGSIAGQETSRMLYFPRAAFGPGSFHGENARTTLRLINPNGFQVKAELIVTGPEDRPGYTIPRWQRYLEFPAKSMVLVDIGQLDSYTPSFSGHATVEVTSSRGGLLGFETIELVEPNTILTFAAAYPEEATQSYSAQLASGADVFTSLKLYNAGDIARNITLRSIADDGQPLADAVRLVLEPGQELEGDASELFVFSVPDALRVGSLSVEADGPGILGNVVFGDPRELRYAAAMPLQSELLTHAVFGHVANVDNFFTGLALLNPGEAAATVRVSVFTANGALTASRDLSLAPGSRIAQLLAELVPPSAGQAGGYVELTSSVPIVAQQLFGDVGLNMMAAVPPHLLTTGH